MGTHMPDTYQHFGKRSNLSNGHRHARTEKRIVLVDFQIDRGARPRNDRTNSWKILRAIVATQIGHDSYPGKHLALKRTFPSIQIGAIDRGQISVVIRIAEKDIASGRNLSIRQPGGNN